ncbi:class I SAM-dependent methyltransferase [bacterium]|jgi:SAM-dependent methyltransferase|nr:class I SAM-dependent methyltransferase [bacterium]
MKSNSYLQTIYNQKRTPYTGYPKKLCTYLVDRFRLSRGETLIEVGCGRVEHSLIFKSLGLNVSGIDLSEDSKQYSNGIKIHIVNVETEKFPLKNDSVDIIYSKSFIEHLLHPENFMKECMRILKPGGKMIHLVPDWESQYKTYYDDYTHKTPYTTIGLKDLHIIFGFESVNVEKFYQLPIAWKIPWIKYICILISPFIPVRINIGWLRWSRELMLLSSAKKPTIK